ncbi:hypothetical protein BT69DRAFT_1346546 [Atractiella rhizophila]|nr:hypothetical protein BT69DRAFT_1346546 [Atractiella rhizophila]
MYRFDSTGPVEESLKEVAAFLNDWVLKWEKRVSFELGSQLDVMWSEVCSVRATLNEFFEPDSESGAPTSPIEPERWQQEQISFSHSSSSANLSSPQPQANSVQQSSPPSRLERLPMEVLQHIFDEVVMEYSEDTVALLCLSKPLYRVVQRALYHTPPTLRSLNDVLSLQRALQKRPEIATFVRHLRYAINPPELEMHQRLFILMVLSKCTCLCTLTIFADLPEIFHLLPSFDDHSLLTEPEAVNDIRLHLPELVRCMDRLKTTNIFEEWRRDDLLTPVTQIWVSQPAENYEFIREDYLPGSREYWDPIETPIRAPAELVFPRTLRNLRVRATRSDRQAAFMLQVLTNTIRQNEPLPPLRLLELFIFEQPLDAYVYPIFRHCKGTLEVVRLSLLDEYLVAADESDQVPFRLTNIFYEIVAQLHSLQVLELRLFPLDGWSFPCTGPFVPNIRELALQACFGNGALPDILYDTAARFVDTLDVLYLRDGVFEDWTENEEEYQGILRLARKLQNRGGFGRLIRKDEKLFIHWFIGDAVVAGANVERLKKLAADASMTSFSEIAFFVPWKCDKPHRSLAP